MKVILDCNIWISFLMGYQLEILRYILKERTIEIFICTEIVSEVNDVSKRPKCFTQISNDAINKLNIIFDKYCYRADISTIAKCDIRDPKDLYLLSFSESVHADYLVSGDKDLLVLNQYQNTQIISLADFKHIITSV